ncbi:MAG TPA: DUF6328 family protein [Alphaproteobacteria bacterium]|nr:DUF6328 family protein [Alphaproteobacteria bacterium]
MTPLKEKVKKALEETRILVLGSQILLGFKFHSSFHPGFEKLAPHGHWLMALSLVALLVTFALLLLPTPFHRLVEGGNDTPQMHRATSLVATLALVPFAAALALDFGVAIETAFGALAGLATGIAMGVLALFLWYGVEFMLKREGAKPMRNEQSDEKTSLKDKISHVLVEARIILPGAQAMLGFQLAAYFTEAFEKLSMSSRLVHTASVLCIGLTVLLLMMPAAYHRIVDGGEDTPDFDRFASRVVLGALVPLSLGLGGEAYVFFIRAFHDQALAAAAGAVTIVLLLAAWFLVPVAVRAARHTRALPQTSAGE